MADVQHEKGKSDLIIDGPGSVTPAPEGEGEKVEQERAKDGGFINGKPATKEQIERSTQVR